MKYTKYEKARIIGARALQLSMGAPFMLQFSEDDIKAAKYDVLELAKREFEKGVIPITVRRSIPEYVPERESKPKIVIPMDELSTEVEKIATIEEQAPVEEEE
ncbi:MAG: DNA-directed RNA polymerase subunit K [Candidatus Woesearchaeota archaeon]